MDEARRLRRFLSVPLRPTTSYPFTESVFAKGIVYSDGQRTARNPAELQQLFVAHGANEVFARFSTELTYTAGPGDHSVARGLERARLAAALKLPFNPELGLYKTYGDARCQPPPDFSGYPEIRLPGAWPTLTLEQMAAALRTYGSLIARQILATGATVKIWDIGNEVEFGVAGVALRPDSNACDTTAGGAGWYRPPDAIDPAIGRMTVSRLMSMPETNRIAWLKTHLWPGEATMLEAVAAGIRAANPQARFSTHLSSVAALQPGLASAFFEAMRAGGFDADELGLSYYPTWTNQPRDRLQAFKDTAQGLHDRLRRPVFVAEFGYPAATMHGVFGWNYAVPGYPLTDGGQAAFMQALVSWGSRSGVLSGIRPWAPDLAGPGWGPMALFRVQGKVAMARPGLDAMNAGLRQ